MGEKIVYELREEDVAFLRHRHGQLLKSRDEIEKTLAGSGKKVYAVGDWTSYTLVGMHDVNLQAIFYDEKTRRGPSPIYMKDAIKKWKARQVGVENPKGAITEELMETAKKCGQAGSGRSKVCVDGEEDLAALALFAVLEYGSIIAYGLPDKNGTLMVEVTPEIRKEALSLKGWKKK